MEIDKINDDTFRCILTKEDLEDRNLKFEDFLKNSSQVQELLREVMEQAHDRFGFEVRNNAVALRMMPTQEGDLNIIVCGGTPEEQFKTFMREVIKASGMPPEMLWGEGRPPKDTANVSVSDVKADSVRELFPNLIVSFADLDSVSDYARRIFNNRPVNSDLYKNRQDGRYYLIIRSNRLSKKYFEMILNCFGDYCELYGMDEMREAHIKEEFEPIILKKAVRVMARV